jgi:hypothetical protein
MKKLLAGHGGAAAMRGSPGRAVINTLLRAPSGALIQRLKRKYNAELIGGIECERLRFTLA